MQPVKRPSAALSWCTSADFRFAATLPRTLDKLRKITNEMDNAYEKLADYQAEGETLGFSEELLRCCNTYIMVLDILSHYLVA